MKHLKELAVLTILAVVALIFEGCCDGGCCYEDCDEKVWGLRPTYSNDINDIVKMEDPRALTRPGKIYTYRNYLLVNEVQKGFHIIDNSDPRNPIQEKFLSIAGSNDVAIQNGYIYADQFENLIVVSLDSLLDIVGRNRILSAFENYGYYDAAPDEFDVYYECPDPSLGVVIGWEADSVEYACYR